MKGRSYPSRSPFAHLVKPEERSADDCAQSRDATLRAIWRQLGLAVIDPEDLDSEWGRQFVISYAEQRFGRRGKQA